MQTVILRKNNREKRKLKVRQKVVGTAERPRLTVFRSNKYSYAQLVDDTKGITLASVDMKDLQNLHKSVTKTDAAKEVGKKLAEIAMAKKVKKAVFDRNGYKYHGRIKSIADGAREGGLEF